MGIWLVEPATAEDSPRHDSRIRNRSTAIPGIETPNGQSALAAATADANALTAGGDGVFEVIVLFAGNEADPSATDRWSLSHSGSRSSFSQGFRVDSSMSIPLDECCQRSVRNGPHSSLRRKLRTLYQIDQLMSAAVNGMPVTTLITM